MAFKERGETGSDPIMSAVLPLPTQAPLTILQILQQEFAIIELNGKHGIVQINKLKWQHGMKEAPKLRIHSGVDVKIVLNRRIEEIAITCKPMQVIQDFWNNPNTTLYKNVAFSPMPQFPNTLNLWIGPTIIPCQGSWLTLKQFIDSVLCSDDKASSEYLLNYLAHMLQKPEEKSRIMIVFLGGEGTGKGTFEVILRKIFSATTLLISDVESVIGGFNAQLERAYAVFMDEALFHGNKRATERLKSYVTSDFIQIEEKQMPKRSIESFHRFFAASNSEHFAHIDPDNRRMFYLKVSERFKGNSLYWDKIYHAINNGEVAAMVYDLLTRDLSNFVIQNRPQSQELLSQKIASLPPLEKFWFDCLWRGETSEPFTYSNTLDTEPWELGYFWSTKHILGSFNISMRSSQRYGSTITKNLSDTLSKVCPSAKRIRKMENRNRGWGYELPAIDIARKEFERYLGGTPLFWPD
jgi:hypothetical protein